MLHRNFKVVLVLLICLAVQVFTAEAVDKKANNASYCRSSLNSQQFSVETDRNSYMLNSISQYIKLQGHHLISSLIHFVNNRKTNFQSFMHSAHVQIQSSISVYLWALPLILGMCLLWCWGIFSEPQIKPVKEQANKSIQLSVKTQIGLAGMILSLMVVIAFALYGINQAAHIRFGFNHLACTIFSGPTGFSRSNQNQGLHQFSEQIASFRQQSVKPLSHQWQQILNSSSLFNSSKQIARMIQINILTNDTQFTGSSLKEIVFQLEKIGRLSNKVKDHIEIFSATLEYVREVAIGLRILIVNLQKYLERYLGVTNIGLFFGLGTQLMYFWFILVALVSMVAISHVLINELYDRQLTKDIVLYLLGICCCIGLALALVGSVAVPTAVWTSQAFDFVLRNQSDASSQIVGTGALNYMVSSVIMKFHPQSDGKYSNLYDSQLLNSTRELIHVLQNFKLNAVNNFQSLENNKQINMSDIEVKLRQQLSPQRALKFIEEINDIEILLKSIIQDLQKPDGELNRLDSAAMGRYMRKVKEAVYVPLFNCIYEHTWLFGYSSWGFIVSLLFTSMIREFDKSYVRLSHREDERQKLSIGEDSSPRFRRQLSF